MYFPKNKIKTGFTSNGDLKIKLSDQPYYGPYFKTSTGKIYAGDTPNYDNLVELSPNTIPVIDGSKNDELASDERFDGGINGDYSDQRGIKLGDPVPQPPKFSPPNPTNQELSQGEYVRYFAKRTNQLIYIEINQQTYDKLKSKDPTILWPLYDCLYMVYSVTSDILNQKLALQIERENQWYGFSSYLGLDT